MIDNAKLEATLKRLPGFERLVSCDRLSAGASRETYRLQVVMHGAERKLALRRAEGEGVSAMSAGPGLGGEAKLFAAARDAGVPGPEVLLVLQPEDGLGAGFFMEWISGETLGGKIAKAPEFAEVRKTLARQCGEILARLHAVDVKASGLDAMLEVLSPEAFVQRTYERYLLLGTPQPMIDFAARWLCKFSRFAPTCYRSSRKRRAAPSFLARPWGNQKIHIALPCNRHVPLPVAVFEPAVFCAPFST